MKKHDEGYILAYVFVILVVICLIATSVLTVPLANLRVQKAAIAELQDQYAAQGAVEDVLAQMGQQIRQLSRSMTYTDLNSAKGDVLKELQTVADRIHAPETGLEGVTVTFPEWPVNVDYDYTFQVTVVRGPVQVSCDAVLGDVIAFSGYYIVQDPHISYSAYTLSEPVEEETEHGT